MLLAALLALTGWTIGAPPSGYELVAARQYDHEQVTRYWRPTTDPDDAPVALWAYDPGHAPFTAPPAPQTTVRRQPAEFSELSSDGDTYGRALRWIEPSGVTLSLEVDGRPSDARLDALAESVREEPPERWKALRIAMSRPPRLDKLPAGMKRVVVRRSRGLTLTARRYRRASRSRPRTGARRATGSAIAVSAATARAAPSRRAGSASAGRSSSTGRCRRG